MNALQPTFTILIIGVTVVCSVIAFRHRDLEERWLFHPEAILAWKQYWRLITSAAVHVSWTHLLFNMVSLYLFGPAIEIRLGPESFLLIYFGSTIGGDLLSLYIHRHHDYRSCGASGGVCGVMFAYIILFPGARIGSLFFPIMIPGWLYAIGFMLASFYGIRTQRDNVGHDAHLGGAIIGLLIAAALQPVWILQTNWKLFVAVLGLALVMLLYLLRNPLMLPMSSAFQFRLPRFGRSSKRIHSQLPQYKQEARQLDDVLEKISKKGVESLTAEEKELLERTSGKYQRRAQSKKPESGLTI
jgi:membrane associated rhomboid family serine protease